MNINKQNKTEKLAAQFTGEPKTPELFEKMRIRFLQVSHLDKKKHLLFLAVIALFGALVIRAWPYTWDDSAITLAFSKNLARYGDVIPTLLNQRVEGYSSFLWMALNAFFFRLGLGETSVVTLAKILSTGFALVNIFLFWKLISANLKTPLGQIIALILFAINSYTIASAVDGMETSLYAFLLLATYFLYKKREAGRVFYVSFTIVGALLIFIRHEGVLFLLPFVGEMLIRRRACFIKEPCLSFWAFAFLAYHTWHYAFFNELLTNPMLAKKYWPYHPDFNGWFDVVKFYGIPLFDFFFRYITIFICLPLYYFLRKRLQNGNQTSENWTLINLIALVSVFIMVITGANWSAAGRLSYPGLAFLLLLIFSKIDDPVFFKQSKILQIGAAIALLFNVIVVVESVRSLTDDSFTLAGVERRASVLAAARSALGLSKITIATPDMGGLLLYYGDGLRVVDLGLLCDKELARNGYAHYEEYIFNQMQPEMIAAPGLWMIPLRKTASFTRLYLPVLVITERDKQVIYLRKDVAVALAGKYAMPRLPADPSLSNDPFTVQAVSDFGSYQVLDLTKSE